MAVVLGTATGSGYTFEIPVTGIIPAPSAVMVIVCAVGVANPFDYGPIAIDIADTEGGGWHQFNIFDMPNRAYLGAIREDIVVPSPLFTSMLMQSALRIGEVTDLFPGDIITVTYQNDAFAYEPDSIVGVAIALPRYTDEAAAQDTPSWGGPMPVILYENADNYPGDSPNADRLTWTTDPLFGPISPAIDTVAVTAAAAYPANSGYTPYAGTPLAEVDSALLSLAVTVVPLTAGTNIDPGGVWANAAVMLVGNYQFVVPAPRPGTHITHEIAFSN